jgi:hypothetical protein
MLSASVSINEVAGDPTHLEFLIVDEDGAVADITGVTVRFALRAVGAASNAVEVEGTVTDAQNGLCEVIVPGASTAALNGVYQYQLLLEDLDLNRETAAEGYAHYKSSLFTD